MASPKAIHTLVLDTGAIIKNDPSVSTLLAQAENLVTVPVILSEIRDAATRSRFETTLKPFLTIQSPSPASIKFVADFARKTGDLAVLSKPDIDIIALTYELECAQNGGDGRLRRTPGQKQLNGNPSEKQGPVQAGRTEAVKSEGGNVIGTDAPPVTATTQDSTESSCPHDAQDFVVTHDDSTSTAEAGVADVDHAPIEADAVNSAVLPVADVANDDHASRETPAVASSVPAEMGDTNHAHASSKTDAAASNPTSPDLDTSTNPQSEDQATDGGPLATNDQSPESSESDSDSGGWITLSNLKKKQAETAAESTAQLSSAGPMQVAVITTDFAMQNVILQINLNLLSPTMSRIKQLKTHVLRCHACFQVCKEMTKQFCPRCGQPALNRVSCSTDAKGVFRLHLKKNMQYNHRGERYSIPKPVHGSSNGMMKGGGKDGWGTELILTEDQKEYEKATREQKRQKERNLMDDDYLPSILTGDRGKTGGRIRVGAGRNVNSKKR